MRRKKPIDPAKRAWWSVHIEAWLASRLTCSAYCKAHGLAQSTMSGWVRRLAPQALQNKAKRPGRRHHSPYSRAARNKAVQAFWAMHVEAMVWSGSNASAYARAHNLCASTLREWRIRLEDEPLETDWREMLHPSARPWIRRRTSSAAKPQAADSNLTRPPEPVRQAAPRRTFTEAEKQAIVAESESPGASAAEVCRRHGIASSMLFRWRVNHGLKRTPTARLSQVVSSEDGAPLVLHGVLPAPEGMTEITLGDGRRVFAPSSADPDTVRRAIALEESRT
jgi:transposase-like protein